MYSGYGSHYGYGESHRKKPKTSWGDTGMRSATQYSSGSKPSDMLSSLTSNPGFTAWNRNRQVSMYDHDSQLSDSSSYGSAGMTRHATGVNQGRGLGWARSRYEDRSSHSGAEGSSFSRYGSGRGRGLRSGLGQTRSYQQGPSSLRKQTDTSGRSVVPERQETDESTDLAQTMAAEIQRRKKGKVDVGKVLKVMQMLEQMEETKIDEYSEERFVENRDRSGASSARQEGFGSHGAGMGLGVSDVGSDPGMTYSYDTNVTAWDPDMEMVGQGIESIYEPRDCEGLTEKPGIGSREAYEDYPRVHKSVPTPSQRMYPRQEQPKSLLEMDIITPVVTRKPVAERPSSSQWSYPSGDTQEGSLFWKLSRFVAFIKAEDLTKNPINIIESVIDKCKVGFTKDFKFEHFIDPENKPVTSGRLFLDKAFLARVNGTTRKDVKNECYAEAMKVLRTVPVGAILKQQDPKELGFGFLTIKQKESSAMEQKTASADKGKVTHVEEKKMYGKPQSKLEMLIDHVKIVESEDTDLITVLNDSFRQCGFDHSYTEEESKCVSGIPWFIGKLKVDDTLMGAGSGPSKRSAMKNSYKKALSLLQKCSLQIVKRGVLFKLMDLRPQFEVLSVRHQRLPNKDTEKRLRKVIRNVLYIPKRGSVQIGIINAAKKANLVLMCLYKMGCRDESQQRYTTVCEIYLDNIFISMGEDLMQDNAQLQAHQEALTVLSSNSAEKIFHKFRRLSPDDSVGVREVSEVLAMEQTRTIFFSLAYRVDRIKTNLPKLEDGSEILLDKDDMIIMESSRWSSDRYNKAYAILQNSAVMNLMVLQSKKNCLENGFKCQMFLQHEKVSEEYGQSKVAASKRAAADILFRMYQTQTTIKMGDHNEINQKMTYEMLKAKADKLKKDTGDTGRDDYLYISSDVCLKNIYDDGNEGIMEEEEKEKKDERPKDGEQTGDSDTPSATLPVNRWLKKVTEDMFEKFSKKESLEEIDLSGDFPQGDLIQIRMTSKKFNLQSIVKRSRNVVGCQIVVHHRYLTSKMLDVLKKNGGSSGRFSIIPKEELPNPSQLGRYLESAPSTSQESQDGARKRKFKLPDPSLRDRW